ncbi:MAG: hypothetical protein LQ350_005120 [Teloschistes chrysophthalmus]|nr:MAG: hypothetical protein LQ350_005120 [Niorma chrysophthalma]
MPNRYSHASVLSHYESRGFISYPDKGRSSPSPSASLLSFDLDEAYVEADNTATPPLTAVPPLCHASTNSTTSPASSFETVPSKPLHSASSSIVTEIYAPGSPVVAPIIGPTLPTKTAPDASKSFNDSKPPDRQPREETLFQNPNFQPNLRYSSAHYFPALCNQPRPSKKQKTAHDDQHVCTPEEPTNPMPISTIPRNTSTRTHKSHKTVTDQYAQYSKTPFERIQPSLSTESLAPLEFLTFDDEDIEDGGPSSPNAAVLPWEYSEDVVPWEYPDNGMPNVHRHSLESGDGDRSLLVKSHSTDSFDSAAPPPIRFHPAFRKELDALKMKGGHAQGPAYGEWMNRVGGRGDDGARAGRRR